ncbi:hypothetical protein ABZ445_36400 [Streptomyces chartreusis]|uniref:hypothetical protein n=1 Tax=Streptomyces chartreusis TaxID=1969 RepID=UPI0033CE97CA
MARRDFDRVITELGQIRGMLEDPATGLSAFHQDQDEMRRKVLETVSMGTTGLREENRELRRRQEKMLSDLGDTRAAVEALRREIAQAWVHTLGVPRPPVSADGSVLPIHVEAREPQALEAGTDGDDSRWEEQTVQEITPEPVGHPGDEAAVGLAPAAGPVPATGPPRPSDTGAVESAGDVSPAGPPAGSERHTPGQDHTTAVDETKRPAHRDALRAAATVASARLICHRDTWAFLLEQTCQHRHFRLPDRVIHLDSTRDGQIEASLSGRSLLAVLAALRDILDGTTAQQDLVTWALADALYQRAHRAVTSTAGATGTGEGSDVITIVLDDRPTPA